MTYFLTIIKYYYIFLTILVLVVPLNYGLIKFLPSLIIMWGSYIFFKKGVRARYLKSKENRITNYNQSNDRFLKKIFILFTLFLIVFIPLYIKFYTGNTIQSALLSFAIGTGADSNYSMYQQYFADNNLNTFSVDKLPYIILNGLSKVTFWFFCIYSDLLFIPTFSLILFFALRVGAHKRCSVSTPLVNHRPLKGKEDGIYNIVNTSTRTNPANYLKSIDFTAISLILPLKKPLLGFSFR